jgi:hypothetical protein
VSAASGAGGERRPAAAIHDLGYKRYVGTRRPQSTRWRVIVKNLVATSWRGWWRMKVWIIGAVLTTVGIGVPMYIAKYISDRPETSDFTRGGTLMSWADALLPMSFQFYSWFGFVLGCTVAAAQVARDLRAGAFEFYFSRPVRPIDYMLGKVGGTVLVMALGVAAGPFVLSLFRVGLSRSSDDLVTTLTMVPRAALVGVVAAMAYAVIPLALSTLSPRPRITISMWVVFYFIYGSIANALAFGLHKADLAVLNVGQAVSGLAYGVFEVTVPHQPVPSVGASTAALAAYIGVGLVLIHMRVRQAERAGLGGG